MQFVICLTESGRVSDTDQVVIRQRESPTRNLEVSVNEIRSTAIWSALMSRTSWPSVKLQIFNSPVSPGASEEETINLSSGLTAIEVTASPWAFMFQTSFPVAASPN